ncbi:hypothetical protein FRC06_009590 [Ceratobasidium sp. 370]|nr:hypothetical protein FRC06_009590 [Ceratobasidium sp. 370]
MGQSQSRPSHLNCATYMKFGALQKTGDMAVMQVSFHRNDRKKTDAERARQREAEKAARSYDNFFTGADDEEEEDEECPEEKPSVALEDDFM